MVFVTHISGESSALPSYVQCVQQVVSSLKLSTFPRTGFKAEIYFAEIPPRRRRIFIRSKGPGLLDLHCFRSTLYVLKITSSRQMYAIAKGNALLVASSTQIERQVFATKPQ